MCMDRQTPAKTRSQGRLRRKGVVKPVSGLKRKGCPGTPTLHIQRISDEVLRSEEGSLYPALHRMEPSRCSC